MAKRPEPKRDIDITAAGYTPLRLLTGAILKRDERKRFEKENAEYQKALEEMGMFEEGGGRANVRRKFMGMKKSEGGKLKRSVDGVASRGLTRASTKAFGKTE